MSSSNRIKGKGWFVNDHGVIYVQGSVNKKFERKSTGMAHTPRNEAYIRKNHREVLLQILNKDKAVVSKDFATFGRGVIEKGIKEKGKKGGRAPREQRDALSKFDRLILPYFKAYSLEEIKASIIEEWQRKLLEKYSTSYVYKCRLLLNEIMHKACADDLVIKNPVQYATEIDVVWEAQDAYTIEEMLLLMDASKGFMRVWLFLAFTTGMRPGEIMALLWSDIILDGEYPVIYLARSVSKGVMVYGSSGNKNHVRIIPLFPDVVQVLKDWKSSSRTVWVLPSRKMKYYSETKSILKAHFRPLLDRTGVRYVPLKNMRHAFSTEVDNKCINIETVNGMVGNSEEVRKRHYNVSFERSREREMKAHDGLEPLVELFFSNKMVR